MDAQAVINDDVIEVIEVAAQGPPGPRNIDDAAAIAAETTARQQAIAAEAAARVQAIADEATARIAALTTETAARQAADQALDVATEKLANRGQANGYAPLGSDGKLPTSIIPALAVQDTFPVASQAEMLALTAQRGDIAVRTDTGKSYALAADDATVLANWLELKATGKVTSVNGQQGVVNLVAGDVGAATEAGLAAQMQALADEAARAQAAEALKADATALAAEAARAQAAEATETTRAINAENALALKPTDVKTADYTLHASDFVLCDTTGGAFTLTLPHAPADGSRFGAKLILPATTPATVTINTAGGDVFNKTGGSTALTLTKTNQALELQYVAMGSSGIYVVIGDDLPFSQITPQAIGAFDSNGLVPASAMRPYTDRGVVAINTNYNPWDLVILKSPMRQVLITAAVTSSGTGFISGSKYVTMRNIQVFDPRDFGAAFDSVTDDYNALQNAINAAGTATGAGFGGGGCIVQCPPGFTTISQSLSLPSNVQLRGSGYAATWIQLRTGANCHMVVTKQAANAGLSNAYYCGVKDLCLDGRKGSQGTQYSDATVTAGSTTVTFASPHNIANGQELRMPGIQPGTTVTAGGGAATQSVTISTTPGTALQGNTVTVPGTPGSQTVQVGGPYHGIYHATTPFNATASGDGQFDPTHRFENLRIYTVHGDGVHLNGRSDVALTNIKVSFCGGTAFYMMFDTHMVGCVAESPCQHGLYIQNSGLIATNLKLYNGGLGSALTTGVGTESGQGYGIWINGPTGTNITGSQVQQWNGTGVRVQNAQATVLQAVIDNAGWSNATVNVPAGQNFAALEVVGSTTGSLIDAAVFQSSQCLRVQGTATKNDIRITHSTPLAGVPDVSADSITLPGSGNRVFINGASVTDRLGDHIDTAFTAPADGHFVYYDGATGKWKNGLGTAGSQFTAGVFGTGLDGNLTLDGTSAITGTSRSGTTYTLTRDIWAVNFTVNSGVTLKTGGWKVYAAGIFTNSAGATISNDGNDSTSSTGGGQTSGQTTAPGTGGGSGAVGAGGGANGNSGAKLGVGAGGAGGAGSGGAAGATVGVSNTSAIPLQSVHFAISGIVYGGVVAAIGGGTGGSAGGGDGTNKGGGGGGGAGAIVIIAKTFINHGTISAKGGNGFTPTVGNCGGGGGGGGGIIAIYSLAAWTNDGTTNVAGGTAGAGVGTGANGSAGGNGTVSNFLVTA